MLYIFCDFHSYSIPCVPIWINNLSILFFVISLASRFQLRNYDILLLRDIWFVSTFLLLQNSCSAHSLISLCALMQQLFKEWIYLGAELPGPRVCMFCTFSKLASKLAAISTLSGACPLPRCSTPFPRVEMVRLESLCQSGKCEMVSHGVANRVQ